MGGLFSGASVSSSPRVHYESVTSVPMKKGFVIFHRVSFCILFFCATFYFSLCMLVFISIYVCHFHVFAAIFACNYSFPHTLPLTNIVFN